MAWVLGEAPGVVGASLPTAIVAVSTKRTHRERRRACVDGLLRHPTSPTAGLINRVRGVLRPVQLLLNCCGSRMTAIAAASVQSKEGIRPHLPLPRGHAFRDMRGELNFTMCGC